MTPLLDQVRRRGPITTVVGSLLLITAIPLDAQERWRLEEIARIGGADEGLASFNDIRDLQLDAKGQVWVLDFQAKSLRLFAPDGKPVREVARSGRGPGEIANSNGFRALPAGGMILRDHSNPVLNIFDADGKFVRLHPFPSFSFGWRLDAGVDAQGRFHEITTQRVDTVRRRIIVRTAADFAHNDTIAAPTGDMCSPLPPPPAAIRGQRGFAGIPFSPQMIQTFAQSGALWCASTGEYRVRRIPFGAAVHDLEVRLDAPRIPIPPAERAAAIAGVDSFLTRIGGALEPFDKDKVPRDRGALMAIVTDERDNLWAIRETPAGPAEFDVWDARGRRVAVVAPGFKVPGFPLMRVFGDRLAIVLTDADDLPTIVVYRIVR
jgi:hypothetical protein